MAPDPPEYPEPPDLNQPDPPDPPDPLDPPDLLDVLVAEHRTVERLFADFETTADRVRRRAMLVAMLAELRRHGSTEERYLYPTTRAYLAAGADLAERVRRLDDADPEFEPLVGELMTGIRHHVQEQETELFPRLRAACVPETLRRLGADAAQEP